MSKKTQRPVIYFSVCLLEGHSSLKSPNFKPKLGEGPKYESEHESAVWLCQRRSTASRSKEMIIPLCLMLVRLCLDIASSFGLPSIIKTLIC